MIGEQFNIRNFSVYTHLELIKTPNALYRTTFHPVILALLILLELTFRTLETMRQHPPRFLSISLSHAETWENPFQSAHGFSTFHAFLKYDAENLCSK